MHGKALRNGYRCHHGGLGLNKERQREEKRRKLCSHFCRAQEGNTLLWYYCKKWTLSWLKLRHIGKGIASSWLFSNENTCISWWGLHLREPNWGLVEAFSFPCPRGSHPLSHPASCFPLFICCLPSAFTVTSHLWHLLTFQSFPFAPSASPMSCRFCCFVTPSSLCWGTWSELCVLLFHC